MKRKIIIPIVLFVAMVNAQHKLSQVELQNMSQELDKTYEEAKVYEALELTEHNFPSEVSFQGFWGGIPVYHAITSINQINSMGVDYLNDGVIPGVSVTGQGMTAYIWDGGLARITHLDFSGRAEQVETTGSNSAHATGVGGVIISAGIAHPNGRGIAHEANLKVLNFTNGNTVSEMNTQANKPENSQYMVSNHSYGSLVGWYYNQNNNNWYWYGYPNLSETESVLFGFYHQTDRAYDTHAYNFPMHSIFKSAGNNRNEGPPSTVDHYVLNTFGNWELVEGVSRPNDCMAQGGYDCISYAGSVAKNLILVGAVTPIGGDNRYTEPSDVVATSFTSFGPTDDGRIKPDVTAIGSGVTAPTNNSNGSNTTWSGTSFSAPAAAGVGVLLQQIAKEKSGGTKYLRSDMMKALLTHTAFESGEHLGPDYKFGYGLINAFGAAKTMLNVDQDSKTADLTLNQGETYTIQVTAKGNEPLKASIAWLDPAGTPLPQLVLNDRTPKLVNDLDLRITQGGNTYFPWRLDPENPAAAATQEDNFVDNVEQVFIENPIAGQQYTITVSHKGNLTNGAQDFALVITGIDSPMSTDDVVQSQAINIYPNPVVDNLNLQTSENLTNVEVRIIDTIGNVVMNETFKSLNTVQRINMSHLPAGVYLAYIKSDKGVVTKKIIKK